MSNIIEGVFTEKDDCGLPVNIISFNEEGLLTLNGKPIDNSRTSAPFFELP